jgi:hypothetical protein
MRRPVVFQAARWRGAEREKGEGGPTGIIVCRRRRREEGEPGTTVGCVGQPATAPGGRQRGAADNGHRSSGAGGGVATRTGKGAGVGDAVRRLTCGPE